MISSPEIFLINSETCLFLNLEITGLEIDRE